MLFLTQQFSIMYIFFSLAVEPRSPKSFLPINSEVLLQKEGPLVAVSGSLENFPSGFVFIILFYFCCTRGSKKMNVSVKDLTVCYDSHQSTKPCSHK